MNFIGEYLQQLIFNIHWESEEWIISRKSHQKIVFIILTFDFREIYLAVKFIFVAAK